MQKPYKNSFFLHTLLLDAEETEKRRRTKKGPKKSNTHFLGDLENRQEVVQPFFSKKSGFSKSSKTPIFIVFPEKNGWQPFVFPEKMGGNHFFQKGYVTRRTALEGKKW